MKKIKYIFIAATMLLSIVYLSHIRDTRAAMSQESLQAFSDNWLDVEICKWETEIYVAVGFEPNNPSVSYKMDDPNVWPPEGEDWTYLQTVKWKILPENVDHHFGCWLSLPSNVHGIALINKEVDFTCYDTMTFTKFNNQ